MVSVFFGHDFWRSIVIELSSTVARSVSKTDALNWSGLSQNGMAQVCGYVGCHHGRTCHSLCLRDGWVSGRPPAPAQPRTGPVGPIRSPWLPRDISRWPNHYGIVSSGRRTNTSSEGFPRRRLKSFHSLKLTFGDGGC